MNVRSDPFLRWALVLNLNITFKCKDQNFVHWNTWTCTFLCQVWTCISLSKCTAGKTELEFRTCTLSISVADFETWRRICIVSSQPCHAGNINGDFDQLNLHLYWSFRLHGKELALFQKVQPFEKLYLHCTWISVQVQVQIFKVIVQKFSLHFQVRPSKVLLQVACFARYIELVAWPVLQLTQNAIVQLCSLRNDTL